MLVTTTPRTPSCDLSRSKIFWSFSCVINVRKPRCFHCVLTTTLPQLTILDLWRYVANLLSKMRILDIYGVVLHRNKVSRAEFSTAFSKFSGNLMTIPRHHPGIVSSSFSSSEQDFL